MWLRFLLFPLALLAGSAATVALVAGLVLALALPNLPSLEALTDYQPKIPLRVYTADGVLIGEFGEERRSVVSIASVPPQLKNAILAAEDERFYQHTGIDYLGVLRAAWANAVTGDRRQGASTITMQVARNFFLSSEKTVSRKVYEVLLAFKIEHSLSKDQILELYINQIYLGQRAYGFAAASETYFGRSMEKLSIAQAAMLAGLPKAPSSYNPIANPPRARQRQSYVLRRMRELGHISEAEYKEALAAPVQARRDANEFAVHAEFVAEMVRQAIFQHYPQDVYTRGFRVYTTLRKADQEAAYAAMRRGLQDYDRSQGYRGPEGYAALTEKAGDEEFDDALAQHPDQDDLLSALVLAADARSVKAVLRSGESVTVAGEGLKFAARGLDPKTVPQKQIRRGAVIRVQRTGGSGAWEIVQVPDAEGSFIALDPRDGAIRALVGGFDFSRNKFNHVTQAWRQPGSSFKPFIYSAALEKGFTPATVVADEPIVIEAEVTGSQRWQPQNYDGKFEGPIRLRTALAKSKNMVSIRVLESIGPAYAQDYIKRFGFDAERHPPYLTMALGAGAVTSWQMARAYGVFANGGYLVEPYFIGRIVDDRGNALGTAQPQQAGDESRRVIDARNAFIMDSMLQDVTRYGTAARASRLKRGDIAGKTGTTNEFVDAWFAGYQPTLVGIAWVGFDQPRSLGRNQTGGAVSLPIWISFMEKALRGVPEAAHEVPEGVTRTETGPDPTKNKPVQEYFYKENVTPVPAPAVQAATPSTQASALVQAAAPVENRTLPGRSASDPR